MCHDQVPIFARLILPLIPIYLCFSPLYGSTVALAPQPSPAVAQPGVTSVSLIGFGFPAGSIAPADVTVTFQPVAGGGGPSGSVFASAVQAIFGSTQRVTF